ncbi:MAG: ParB/RepB/Spo0J family partition protein [Lachnospiraceae bacterium]|nr:ParB/RepB/Spo0J family partition protein [Lachnospiraceae bacterium]
MATSKSSSAKGKDQTGKSTSAKGKEPVRKSALGKGLNNLIPTGDSTDTATKAEPKVQIKEVIKEAVQTLPINKVEPNRDQPRKNFNQDKLEELADSISKHGIVQPLIVKKRRNYYEIVAGERRWRAAKSLGLKEVPVVIKDYSDKEIMEIALIENLQREDLNPIEEALAYQGLIEENKLTQDEVAEKVSKSRSTIANALRLLKLDQRVQQMLIDDMLTTGHVRALITVTDPDAQYEAATYIFDRQLSVRETESFVKKLLSKKKEIPTDTSGEQDLSFIYRDLEERMKTNLGTKASIKPKAGGRGKIEIEYYSQDELERLTNMLITPIKE